MLYIEKGLYVLFELLPDTVWEDLSQLVLAMLDPCIWHQAGNSGSIKEEHRGLWEQTNHAGGKLAGIFFFFLVIAIK